MKNKKSYLKHLDSNSRFVARLCDLYEKFKADHETMQAVWEADDYDFMAAEPTGYVLESLLHKPPNEADPDAWRDKTCMSMKARTKLSAFEAQMAQQLLQDDQLPIGLKLSDESDFEEAFRKHIPEYFAPTEDEVKYIRDQQKPLLEKWKKRLFDAARENNYVGKVLKFIHLYGKYGACAIHAGIPKKKKIRAFMYAVSEEASQVNPDGTPAGMEMDAESRYTPLNDIVESTTLDIDVYEPLHCILDPGANADPQCGAAVFLTDRIDRFELAGLKDFEGYDGNTIRALLEGTSALTEHSSGATYERTIGEITFGSSDVNERWDRVICYGRMLFRDILEMEEFKDDKKLTKLVAELKELDTDEYDVVDFKATIVDNICVELIRWEGDRPVSYDTLVHLYGTNYGFSILSLCRPITTSMTRLWRRAVDNETVVGNAMLAVDEAMIDMSTMVIRPGQIIKNKAGASVMGGRGSGVAQVGPFQSVSAYLLALFDKLDQMMDEMSMIPRNLTGLYDPANRTATEASQTLTSAQTVILSLMRSVDKNVLVPMIQHILFQLLRKANPSELVDAVVYAFGAETFIIRMLNKKMIQELLMVMPGIIQHHPGAATEINWGEVVAEYLESLGMDVEKFRNTPEIQGQLKYLTEQLQQAAQQLEAAAKMEKEHEKMKGELDEAERELFDYKSKNAVENQLTLERVQNENLTQEVKDLRAQLGAMKAVSRVGSRAPNA